MYSLIVPIYNNEENIPDLLDALKSIRESMGSQLEVIFVVDGSPDDSYEKLHQALPDQPFSSELICLARNFGSFSAIRMGFSAAQGPYFAVMAADSQEPPELIVDFFRTLESEPVDITLGVRQSRDDPWPTRLASNIFWGLYRKFIQKEVPPSGVDVFGCNEKVRQVFVEMKEANSTLIGLLIWIGFRRKEIPYHRQKRHHGTSAWSFRKKFRYMMDSAYAFSDLPIILLIATGFFGVFFSVVAGAVVLSAWASGMIHVPGYTPLILTLLFSTSSILLSIGILGGYIWRAFENTKGRPLYIPVSQESFRKEPES